MSLNAKRVTDKLPYFIKKLKEMSSTIILSFRPIQHCHILQTQFLVYVVMLFIKIIVEIKYLGGY